MMAEDKKTNPEAKDSGAEAPAAEAGAEGQAPAKKKSMLIFIILGAVVVLGAAAGGFFMLSSKAPEPTDAAHAEVEEPKVEIPAVYFDMPDLLVNLASPPDQQRFLKLKLTLELPGQAPGEGEASAEAKDGEAPPELKKVLPRIIDDFQIYLRELRAEDLQGSVGTFRLKQALLQRANQAAHPVEINNVLIKELLVQ